MCGKFHQTYKSKFVLRSNLKANHFTIDTATPQQKNKRLRCRDAFSFFLCMFFLSTKRQNELVLLFFIVRY